LTVVQSLKFLGGLFKKCREEGFDSTLNLFGFDTTLGEVVANIVIRRGIAYKTSSAGPEGNSDKRTASLWGAQINRDQKEMLGEFVQQARLAHPR
jgi:hypothetical protein